MLLQLLLAVLLVVAIKPIVVDPPLVQLGVVFEDLVLKEGGRPVLWELIVGVDNRLLSKYIKLKSNYVWVSIEGKQELQL